MNMEHYRCDGYLIAVLLVNPKQTIHIVAFTRSHNLNTVLEHELNSTYHLCECILYNIVVLDYIKYMTQIHLKTIIFCDDMPLHIQPFDDSYSYSYKKFFSGRGKCFALPSSVSFVTSFLEQSISNTTK